MFARRDAVETRVRRTEYDMHPSGRTRLVKRCALFPARMKARAFLVAALVTCVAFTAAALPDDRAAAEATLKEVESSPKKDVAQEMITRAKAALARGATLRASGDEPHARLADGVARTWAEAARDVVRAVDVEERAAAARRGATDAGTIADRERALLEEGVAQSGRLRAQLESVERDAKEQPARTSSQADKAEKDAGAAVAKPPPSGVKK
jgi:hypothetical protein